MPSSIAYLGINFSVKATRPGCVFENTLYHMCLFVTGSHSRRARRPEGVAPSGMHGLNLPKCCQKGLGPSEALLEPEGLDFFDTSQFLTASRDIATHYIRLKNIQCTVVEQEVPPPPLLHHHCCCCRRHHVVLPRLPSLGCRHCRGGCSG